MLYLLPVVIVAIHATRWLMRQGLDDGEKPDNMEWLLASAFGLMAGIFWPITLAFAGATMLVRFLAGGYRRTDQPQETKTR